MTEEGKRYWALDMVNGKTLIGWKNDRMSRDTDNYCLEDVLVTETLTNKQPSPTRNYMYVDIKQQYINIYKEVVRDGKLELPNIDLNKTDSSSSGRPIHAVVRWYLGEDILKKEKKIKGNI